MLSVPSAYFNPYGVKPIYSYMNHMVVNSFLTDLVYI